MKQGSNKSEQEEDLSTKAINRRTFLAFGIFAAMYGMGCTGWKWLRNQKEDGGVLEPLRQVLNANEKIFTSAYKQTNLAETYPVSEALKNPRINGHIGIEGKLLQDDWNLEVNKADGKSFLVSLDDIRKLPKTEIVFNFKCIEGWSQITHWGGIVLHDFLSHFNLSDEKEMKYIGMATPDRQYYVGIDMPSALHPQTLLCYEMNGSLLTSEHGSPLRLIIPVKYGIKHLKRIGSIYFADQRPPDYWAERGYDYYSGH